MKLICGLLLLQLLLVSRASAADLTPVQIEPLDRDLARPFLQMHKAGDFNLGLGFREGQGYALDPRDPVKVPSRSIDRSLRLAVRLPMRFELGLSLHGHQESQPLSDDALSSDPQAKSRPLGSLYWLRWYLMQTESLQTSVVLQYEPAYGPAESYSQLKQNRTSLALVQEYSPLDWMHGAVYVSGSSRQKEAYRDLLLSNELSYGLRATLGPAIAHAFGEVQMRRLQVSNASADMDQAKTIQNQFYKAGFGTAMQSFDLSAYALIPQAKPTAGMPADGFMIVTSYRLDSGSRTDEESTARHSKKSKQAARRVDVPVANTENPGGEADEFQLLEKVLDDESAKSQIETPSEQAERELKEMQASEKQRKETEASQQARQQRDDDRAIGQQIKEDNAAMREYKDEINEELDQYALPDAEETNWNGLRP